MTYVMTEATKARLTSYFVPDPFWSNRRMKIPGYLLIFVLSACGEAPANQSDTHSTETVPDKTTQEVIGERLLAAPPQGWQLTYRTNTTNMGLSTYVPETDDPNDWRQKITIERVSGEPLDPIYFLTSLAADQQSTCDNFNHTNTFSGLENGYPTSVRLFVCDNNPLLKLGQVTLIKAIQGDEFSYIITRTKRMDSFTGGSLPLSEEEMGGWSLYLRAIKVCNPDDEEHTCSSQNRSEGNALTT